LEITTLLIPGENDSDQEIERLSQWIVENLGPEVPLHFSAFHPDWKMRTTPKTPASTVQRARQIAMKNGLHYVYTGNIYDPLGGSTYCPACQHCVIERDYYSLGTWSLTEQGACSRCGTHIAGVFNSGPGDWDARRQRVFIQGE
jgi:pyruvate formate lyase activating enzyme